MLARLAAQAGRKSLSTKPAEPEQKKPYRILDVKTHQEGYLRLRPLLFFAFALFCNGGLNVLYELVLLNVEDRDTRDLLYDQRVTAEGIQRHHLHFRTAHWPYLGYGGDPKHASESLPVINYKAWEPKCYFEDMIPCLATSHEDRDEEEEGPLNIGSDYGMWAVAGNHSLVRNETFNGVVRDIQYKYERPEDLIADFPDSIDIIRTFPQDQVPVPRFINITRKLQPNLWSENDWATYVRRTWFDILNVTCPRRFNLCSQTEAVFPLAIEENPGLFRINIDRLRESNTEVGNRNDYPSMETWRDRKWHHPHRPIGRDAVNGFVDPNLVLEFAREIIEKRAPDPDYLRPNPRVPLSEAVYVDDRQVKQKLKYEEFPTINYMGWEADIWYWKTPCSGTSSRQWHLEGTAGDLTRPPFSMSEPAFLKVSELYEERMLAWFTWEADYDAGTIKVDALRSLTVYISLSALRGEDSAWKVHRVEGEYEEIWTGDIDAAAAAIPADQVSLTVFQRDLSETMRTTLPKMHGYYRVHYSLAMAAAIGLILLSMPYLLYVIHRNVMENNNLPPPFYHQRLEYRGW